MDGSEEVEREPILISALNHYLFCPRRCALIHVEGCFVENASTLEGRFLHDRTDTPGVEERSGVRIVRALPIFSRRLAIQGKADVVEFHASGAGEEVPYPVEYKRGARRQWDNDDVQLCAQALCLEEMLGQSVPMGAIYHARTHRRREVELSADLRRKTEEAISQVRELLRAQCVPAAELHPKCDGCSLRGQCLPEATGGTSALAAYLARILGREA